MALRNMKDDGLWGKGYSGIVGRGSDFDPTGISKEQLRFFLLPVYLSLCMSVCSDPADWAWSVERVDEKNSYSL